MLFAEVCIFEVLGAENSQPCMTAMTMRNEIQKRGRLALGDCFRF